MTQSTYAIPSWNLAGLLAKLAKLQKRAAKLAVAVPTVEQGEAYEVEGISETGGKTITRYVPVTVVQPEPVSLDGWTFLGTIQHEWAEDGYLNIVRSVPDFEGQVPASYRTDAPTCDHCRTERRRVETFVVRDEGGELRRVGRQCVRDYLGHTSGEALLAAAQYLKALAGALDEWSDEGGYGAGEWRVPVIDLLTWAAVAIRTYGWVSRSKARDEGGQSTADTAWHHVTRARGLRQPTPREGKLPDIEEQDRIDARDALAWAKSIPLDVASDYLHNLHAGCAKASVTEDDVGIVVSAVSAYQRKRDQELAERARLAKPSEWLAQPGQRFGGKGKAGIPTVEGTVLKRHSFEGNYGLTTILVIQTDNGDELINFNSGRVEADIQVGRRVEVVGTVKKHQLCRYTSRKQTAITRASLSLVG